MLKIFQNSIGCAALLGDELSASFASRTCAQQHYVLKNHNCSKKMGQSILFSIGFMRFLSCNQ